MNRTPVGLIVLGCFCLLITTGCGATVPAEPSPVVGDPHAISGFVFRDLNGNGIRDLREPGEPGVAVSVYDGNQKLIAAARTDVKGEYVLISADASVPLQPDGEYAVVFSDWLDFLAPAPHGQDSGTEQQFARGGDTNISFGLFNPDQFVPPEGTVIALLTPQAKDQALVDESTPTPGAGEAADVRGAPAPAFPPGVEWLNTTRPLTWDDLRGKVVLLEFWTYGCINSMQSIPKLALLEEKYSAELVVISVHSAKFAHEKATANLRNSILRLGVTNPVINDGDYAVAGLYGAHIWPTFVLVDPAGHNIGSYSGPLPYAQFDQRIGETIAAFEAQGLMDRLPLNPLAPELMSDTASSPLLFPHAVLADETRGQLYIVDSNHNRILITDFSGVVLDVIGSGNPAFIDGDYPTAGFYQPQNAALAEDGTLYIADTFNHAIRRVDLDARFVETVAGVGERYLLQADEGPALASRLNSPWAVQAVGGMVYIAMAGQHELWVYDPVKAWLAPFAGNGTEEMRDGPLLKAGLNQPTALTTDGQALYIADSEASAVRTADLDPSGSVRTIVGLDFYVFGDVDGTGDAVRLQRPAGIAYQDGLLYVADTYNNKIKIVNPSTRESQTWLGTGDAGYVDGNAPLFDEPNGLSITSDQLYIADTNNHAVRVANLATGEVTTLDIVDPDNRLLRP